MRVCSFVTKPFKFLRNNTKVIISIEQISFLFRDFIQRIWYLSCRKKQRHSIPVSICKLLLINAIIAMGKLLVSK